MKVRILAAAVLLPLLIVIVVFLPKVVTAILFGVMCALGAYELLQSTGLVKHPRLVIYAMVSGFAVAMWSYFGANYAFGILWVLGFLAAMFGEMMHAKGKLRFEKVTITMFAGLGVPYLLCSLLRIFTMENVGRHLVFAPFVIAFLSDTCAYFAGSAFGKRKLAPVISPKKTVEGMLGGVAGAMLGMVWYGIVLNMAFDFSVNYIFALIYGLVGAFGGVFGDLCFSVIKRQTGIKDYGNLIPGHGGVLDRFDSMIIVGPLVEALLAVIPLAVR